MGDIAAVLPEQSQTVRAIFSHYKQTGDAEPRRGYLGASQIGHECPRYLWYSFRWCGGEDFDGRMYRLFDRGDMEEFRMIADLRAIGCEVHDRDPGTGGQFEVSALGGHFSGHMDGCAAGIPEAPAAWHVLEFKTHNASSFARLCRDGVRASKKMHYDQMMVYMHLTGMTRALYLACNKDTDDLYSERIRYDQQYAVNLLALAERIITASMPPEISGELTACRYCPYRGLCRGESEFVSAAGISCRTCSCSTPVMDGRARWECSLLDRKPLSLNDQIRACGWHVFHPQLLTASKGVDSSQNPDGSVWVEYETPDGRRWQNGPDTAAGQYSSAELTRTPAAMIGQPGLSAVKALFHGEVTAGAPA